MLELFITKILKSLFFPPGGMLLAILVGLLLLKRKPLWGKGLIWAGLVSAYLFSTPLVSTLLEKQVQSYPPLSEMGIKQAPAQAIVVLSAGRYRDAPEYGGDTVGNYSLVRIRYGAYLHRMTSLPVLVSGGRVFEQEGKSLAQVMADSLQNDFHVQPVWLEEQSRTTAENAKLSQALLAEKGIDTVFLVTHASHMPRSVAIFEQAGLKVIPAPTRFSLMGDDWLLLILPSASAMQGSYFAMHELVGRVWYAIRH